MNKYFIFSNRKYHPDHSRGHPVHPSGYPDSRRSTMDIQEIEGIRKRLEKMKKMGPKK
jgi:hypothetical protein